MGSKKDHPSGNPFRPRKPAIVRAGLRHVVRRGLAAVMMAALGLAMVAPASAARDELEGFWYFERFGVADIHASGVTGEGVTIAVIDSPLNPDVPTLRGASVEIMDSFCYDESGNRRASTTTDIDLGVHGTAVLSLVVGTGEGYPGQTGVKGVAPGADVLYYPNYIGFSDAFDCHNYVTHPETSPFYSEFGSQEPDGEPRRHGHIIAWSIVDAVDRGADIISISAGESASSVIDTAVAYAFQHGVIVVGALHNRHIPGGINRDVPPGDSNSVLSVMAADINGQLMTGLNDEPIVSEYVDVVAPGVNVVVQGHPERDWQYQYMETGTSIATPIVASYLALAMDKYPEAHPWQILQSLVHNTGREGNPDATWEEGFGYGGVLPEVFLAADPTVYPALNPFVSDDMLPELWQLCWDLEEYWTLDDPPAEDGPYCQDALATAPDTDPSEPANPDDPAPGNSDDPQATPPTDTNPLGTLLIIGGIIAIIILATAIILIITLTKRKGPQAS